MSEAERHEDRCPTCGKFVALEAEKTFYDLPPNSFQSGSYITPYCDEGCADKKPGLCMYEDEESLVDKGDPAAMSKAARIRASWGLK